MGIDNFWQQPNERRFKFGETPNKINLDNASRELGISKKSLKSIFDKNDTNKNGFIDNDGYTGFEYENFLRDVNAEFTNIDTVNKTRTIKFHNNEGHEITEVYNSSNELIEKNVVMVQDEGSSNQSVTKVYSKYENGYTVYSSTSVNDELLFEGDVEYKDGIPQKRVITTKDNQTITTFRNGMEAEEAVYDTSDNQKKLVQKTVYQEDGSIKIFGITQDGNISEMICQPDNSAVTYLYAGDDIQSYLEGNAKLLSETKSQGDKVTNQIEYKEENGRQYTKIYAKNNVDSWEGLAKLFNTTEAELKRINKGGKGEVQAGEPYWVPGIYHFEDAKLKNRYIIDAGKSKSVIADHEFKKAKETVITSEIIKDELKSDFKNVYDYAKYIAHAWNRVSRDDPEYKAKVNELANQLILLNGQDFKYKSGAKVKIVGRRLSQEERTSLKDLGFEPNEDNWLFYMRFNCLNNTQRKNILDILKQCKAQGITDRAQINARIVRLYPHLQMFETDEAKLKQPTKAEERMFLADLLLYQVLNMANMVLSMNENTKINYINPVSEDFVLWNPTKLLTSATMGLQNLTGTGNKNYQEKLKYLIEKCVELKNIAKGEIQSADEGVGTKQISSKKAEEDFKRIFSEICPGVTLDYNALNDYFRFIQEHPEPRTMRVGQDLRQTVAVDPEWTKKEKEFKDKFMPGLDGLSKDIESWAGTTSQIGGLMTFAAELLILHKAGAMRTIGTHTKAVTGFAQKMNLGVRSSQLLTGAVAGAETATVFSLRPMIETVGHHIHDYVGGEKPADGESPKPKGITDRELGVIGEHWYGLFKFGMFGHIVAGNLGALSEQMVVRARNSRFLLQKSLSNAIQKNGAEFNKILEKYSNRTTTMGEWTREIVSFASNVGFMAADDDMGVEEAGVSFAQMDMISKLVAGMLGAKAVQAIPRQRILDVESRLNNYEVKFMDGKFIVTTPEGEVKVCNNQREYFNYTFEVTLMELAKSIEANRQQYAEAHQIENNISEESRQKLEELKERLPEKPDEEKNGLYRNDDAEFTVEKGKIVKIVTKDGREITDPLKIAKYETKYGVDISKLEAVKAKIVNIEEGRTPEPDEKAKPRRAGIVAAFPFPVPVKVVEWLTGGDGKTETTEKLTQTKEPSDNQAIKRTPDEASAGVEIGSREHTVTPEKINFGIDDMAPEKPHDDNVDKMEEIKGQAQNINNNEQLGITQTQIPVLDLTLLANITNSNSKLPKVGSASKGIIKDSYKFFAKSHNGDFIKDDENHYYIVDKSNGKIIRECFFDKDNPQNNTERFYSYSEDGNSTCVTVNGERKIISVEHVLFDKNSNSTIKIEYGTSKKIKVITDNGVEELLPIEFMQKYKCKLDYYNLIEHTEVDISVTKTDKSIKDITESKSNLSKTSTSDRSNFIFTPQDRFTGIYHNIASYDKLDISKYFDEDGIFHFNLEIKNEKGEIVRKINKARDWFYNEENNLLEIRDHETGEILISTDCADEYLDLLSDIQKAHKKGKISDKHFETYLSETMPIEKLRVILDSLSFYESLPPREKEALFNLLTSYKIGSRKFMTYYVKKADGTIERTKTAWGARKSLDKILEKSIINEDINVTRYEKDLGFFDSISLHKLGISFGDAIRSLEGKSQKEIKQYIQENMSEAFEMCDPTSTFLNTETHYFARNSIKMNIKISKGAKGIYLEDIRDQSKGSYESELLLKQNQAYKITDIRFEDGKTIIDITLLPKDIE